MFVRKPLGICPRGRSRRIWEDNITTDLSGSVVAVTNSGSCSVVGFSTRGIEPPGSATII